MIRRGLDALTRAVRSRDAADVELLIANLQEIAVEHHGKEEEILFPAVDEAFSGDAASALTRRLMLG